MSQHYINDNINCFNNTNNFNIAWNNSTVANEKSEILAWLSPLEPQIRHQDIRIRRVDEVGDWLLQTHEYRNWFGGIHGVNLMVRPCFATEVRGLARPTLGKREKTRGKKYISTKL